MIANLAPILIFVYNRPEHTSRLIDSLVNCELSKESDLFIFIDAPKLDAVNIDKNLQVEKMAREITHFKSVTIYKNDVNKGVDKSIIDGVTKIINKLGKVIVLEDDLVVGKDFLRFLNWGLSNYEADLRMYSVNGFMFPIEYTGKNDVVLLPFSSAWGWGTWKDRWDNFDYDNGNRRLIFDSVELSSIFNLPGIDYGKMLIDNNECWDINWYFHVFKNNGLNIFPVKSLIKNTGFDGSGVHCPNDELIQNFNQNTILKLEKVTEKNLVFFDLYLKYFSELKKRNSVTIKQKIKNNILNLLKQFKIN